MGNPRGGGRRGDGAKGMMATGMVGAHGKKKHEEAFSTRNRG